MSADGKRVRLSLKVKLSAFALLILVIIVGAGYEFFVKPTGDLLQRTLLTKGRALCQNLAYNVRFGVLTGDELELGKNVEGVIAEEDVLYVLIYNRDGSEIVLKAPSGELGRKAMEMALEVAFDADTAQTPIALQLPGSGEAFYDVVSTVRRSESAGSADVEGLGSSSDGERGAIIGYVHLGVALKDIREAEAEFRRHLMVVTGLIAVPGLTAVVLLIWFVITPLNRMSTVADKIAAGDLTEAVEVTSRDEIGLLAQSFNEMLDGLRALARELTAAGGQLSNSASEILTAAEEQSASSREQSVSVNETTATMEELAQTSKQIAENSDRVARTAEETFHTAQSGSKAVEDTIAGMMSIKAQTENNTNKIFALGDRIQKIGNVVKIINDIADQTKLIAFNAAIEAAGAGEAGKRFSIVAVEVRRLADTVVESIEEIKNTITEIQLATNELILSSEKGIKDVEEGVNVASRAGEALQKIIAMIKHTTESSKQISLSTQQQRTASEQVVISMKEVSKTANQTASSSKQTIAIATELNQLSEQLGAVVKRFDLGNGDGGGRASATAAKRPREG